MPELPEVETIRTDLIRAGLPGRIIRSADLFWHRTLAVPSLKEFQKKIAGSKIKDLARRGKYLIFHLEKTFLKSERLSPHGAACPREGGERGSKIPDRVREDKKRGAFLIMHLRMSGKIDLKPGAFALRPHDRARLVFENGEQLLFHDTRKFGRWYFTDDREKIVGKLGIEPLDVKFTAAWLSGKLKNKKRILKPLLLDQTLIAGIGNIYADEALWYAKLNPTINSSRLTSAEVAALHAGIVKAIMAGIRNAGTSMGGGKANFYSVGGKRGDNQDNLKVFRRTGEPCPLCRAKIERIVVGQRSTHFCPQCQRLSAGNRTGKNHGNKL